MFKYENELFYHKARFKIFVLIVEILDSRLFAEGTLDLSLSFNCCNVLRELRMMDEYNHVQKP